MQRHVPLFGPATLGPPATIALALLVASCSAPPPRAPAPAPAPVVRPAPPPAPPRAADWRDWPVTPGTWTYRQDARGSLALFGQPGTDALLTLRCARNDNGAARAVYLSRAGVAATPLTLRTTSTVRALAVQPTGGTPPFVAAALAPTDPLLDAIGFSRGRFTVEQAGSATLVVPAWPEIERVTEDCRG